MERQAHLLLLRLLEFLWDSSFVEHTKQGPTCLCANASRGPHSRLLCFSTLKLATGYVDEGVLEYVSSILMGTDNTGFASPDVKTMETIPSSWQQSFEFYTSNSTGSWTNTTNSTLEEVNKIAL